MPPLPVINLDAERSRLAALRAYGILDTEAEREFDDIARRAAQECGYEFGLLTFMDAERCWIKAAAGLQPRDASTRELPRAETFCDYALRSSAILVVPDAPADARFRNLGFVKRADGFRAYVGAQLITPDGHSIGTLCVLDRQPRQPTAEQLTALRRLAIDAMALLELRRARDDAPAPSVIVPVAPRPERRSVLVVDDEVVVRQFLEFFLRECQVPVFSAENGTDALAVYRRHAGEIGLVLTDIHMPVLDGYGLIAELKNDAQPPLLAVMTGRLDPLMRAQLTGMGVARILAKPFALVEVKETVALVSA
jgi:CheY-like chemotaxis protein